MLKGGFHMRKGYRTAAAASALLITAGVLFSAVSAAVQGDVNQDGSLDRNDALKLRAVLTAESSDLKAEMDFNGDRTVDAKDLSAMKHSILNPPQQVQPQNPWEQQQGQEQQGDTPSGIKDYGTPMDTSATMISEFRKGDAGDFFASDGWTNGKPFDCWWYQRNAVVQNGMLTLSIDQKWKSGDSNPDWNPQYSGGEFRTNKFYHYGYYETSMQAIKNDGVVSSFFTYTGPSDNNPWDEIDVEILGKDTTKVQLNYYKDGQGGHEYMYDLGFDASQDFHRYGFDWQPDHITWYVDGKEAYTMRGDMPKTPGKIMMNAWPGRTVDDWLKAFNGNKPLTAYYQWVTYNKQ